MYKGFHGIAGWKLDNSANQDTAPQKVLAHLQEVLGAEELAELREEVVKRALRALRST
jgi:hypothetical protein